MRSQICPIRAFSISWLTADPWHSRTMANTGGEFRFQGGSRTGLRLPEWVSHALGQARFSYSPTMAARLVNCKSCWFHSAGSSLLNRSQPSSKNSCSRLKPGLAQAEKGRRMRSRRTKLRACGLKERVDYVDASITLGQIVGAQLPTVLASLMSKRRLRRCRMPR